MRKIAIVQARIGSSRLPEKILRMLGGRTVLAHVIERLKAAPELEDVIVATTDSPSDDVVVEAAKQAGAKTFRGSESDVLSRYLGAAAEHDGEVIVRVTSDCPLFDPFVLSAMLREFESAGERIDYMSNVVERTFPRGLDAEIFTRKALERANREAKAGYQREHVTPYFYENPGKFAIRGFRQEQDLSPHRWTLDTKEDLEFLMAVFEQLGRMGGGYAMQDTLRVLEAHPELAGMNAHVTQKSTAY